MSQRPIHLRNRWRTRVHPLTDFLLFPSLPVHPSFHTGGRGEPTLRPEPPPGPPGHAHAAADTVPSAARGMLGVQELMNKICERELRCKKGGRGGGGGVYFFW